MTSGSALFDTNILIDLFSGRREAKQALEAWPPQNAISLITWMEVMVGAKKYHQEQRTRMALSTFNIINISQDIAGEALRCGRSISLSCRMPSFWRRRNSIVWN
ncbi:PIN domain-containing protein [Klebsiella pneumoniae]|nr:PIN domain-containing protein [Klebsiella pneumoniae]